MQSLPQDAANLDCEPLLGRRPALLFRQIHSLEVDVPKRYYGREAIKPTITIGVSEIDK